MISAAVLGWTLAAVAVGIYIGLAIRTADERDPLADQPTEVLKGEALQQRFGNVIDGGWVR